MNTFLLSYSCFIAGNLLFLFGFFAVEYQYPSSATYSDSSSQRLPKPQFNRSILLVIDALRYDFVSRSNFPQSFPVLESKGCLLRLKTNVPTVTMPRIKSITTGTIPKFIDVILNFGNQALTGDSLLHRMKERGDKVVFYGDNTWTNLFPGLFHRSYPNTDSFFVQDFYEGDKNITRGVEKELQDNKDDWNHLILHYLGLDHIGHVEGPFSPKIHEKLKEMDDVIHKILRYAEEENILVLVTGDHGMRSSGGHGGSTPEEIWVPLLAFNEKLQCNDRVDFNQIDLAPTIGVLLGLGIPTSSIGVFLDPLVMSQDDALEGYHVLSKHLMQKVDSKELFGKEFYQDCSQGKTFFDRYKISENMNDYNLAVEHLRICSKKISNELAGGGFDSDMVICGVALIIVVVNYINMLLSTIYDQKDQLFNIKLFLFQVLISLALFSTTKALQISLPCQLLLSFIITSSIWRLTKCSRCFKFYTQKPDKLFFLFVAVTIFHTISFSSSSFIEEEHQTWYFIGSTLLLIASLCCGRRTSSLKEKIKGIFVLSLNIFCRRLNQTGDKWINLPDIGDWLQSKSYYQFLIGGFGILFLVVVLHRSRHWKWTFVHLLCGLSTLSYRFPVSPELAKLSVYLSFVVITCLVFEKGTLLPTLANFCVLLHKPHNIMLVPLEIMTIRMLFSFCEIWSGGGKKTTFYYKAVIAFWIAKMFFFYQGNSNNFATIDVNAGFVGLERFHLILGGAFTVINTFSSQIIATLVVSEEVLRSRRELLPRETPLSSSFKIQGLLAATPLTLYLGFMIIFKNHIFIWTVFSPKCFYEVCHSVLYFLFYLMSLVFLKVEQYLEYNKS